MLPFLEIIGIGLALSMDAFSVAVVNGGLIRELKFRHAFRIAFAFGLFQAIMPVVGWAAGLVFIDYIRAFDHWVAFGLLAIIGGKMIHESRKTGDDCGEGKNCLHTPTLLVLSLATSIDALIVGLSFSILKVHIIVPVIIIGCITFLVCIAGVYIGEKAGHFCEDKFELIGGLILIGIGVKILFEHLL